MLSWSITFLIIGLIAGVLGLSGIAGAATQIAWILFVVFLILFVITLIRGRRPPICHQAECLVTSLYGDFQESASPSVTRHLPAT